MTAQLTLVGRDDIGEVGDELDRHFTPQRLADLCVERLDSLMSYDPKVVVEPSVGGGAFARAARKVWPSAWIIGVDLDPAAEGAAFVDEFILGDWTEVAHTLEVELAVVTGNPPFSGPTAIRHVECALELGDWTSLILPWGFFGGVDRWESLMHGEARPLEAGPVFPRPWPDKMRETALFTWPHRGRHDQDTVVRALPRWR